MSRGRRRRANKKKMPNPLLPTSPEVHPDNVPFLSEWIDDDGLDALPVESRLEILPPSTSSDTHEGTGRSSRSVQVSLEEPNTQHTNAQMLLAALIEYMCSIFDAAPERQRKLYTFLSRELIKCKLIPPVVFTDELHSVRDHYRLALGHLIQKAQQVVHKATPELDGHEPSIAFLPGPQTTKVLTSSPLSALRISTQKFQSEFLGDIWLSRYKREFKEHRVLGKGGFGQVFKVECTLDGCEYAVKKILFEVSNTSLCVKTMREVQMLAKLQHRNIVRYYNAWFEYDDDAENKGLKSLEKTELFSPQPAHIQELLSDESNTNAHGLSENLRRNVSTPNISFGGSLTVSKKGVSGMRKTESERNLEDFSSLSAAQESNNVSSRGQSGGGKFWGGGGSGSSSESEEEGGALVPFVPPDDGLKEKRWPGYGMHPFFGMVMRKTLHLYVQMELCSSTLRDHHRERNKGALLYEDGFGCVDADLNRNMLMQILSGLAYIHGQGVIHRDIKPGNIFLKVPEYEVLLGDFGLACRSGSMGEGGEGTEGRVSALVRKNLHSSGVGTLTYSAPEQLNSSNYGPEVDVFSVGVVAYEMYHPFTTYSEKFRAIMDVRRGAVSEEFQKRWPVEAGIIRQLVHHNPNLRPSARQLADNAYFISTDVPKLKVLRSQLTEKDLEIQTQREEILSHKEEIMRLKEELSKKNQNSS